LIKGSGKEGGQGVAEKPVTALTKGYLGKEASAADGNGGKRLRTMPEEGRDGNDFGFGGEFDSTVLHRQKKGRKYLNDAVEEIGEKKKERGRVPDRFRKFGEEKSIDFFVGEREKKKGSFRRLRKGWGVGRQAQ